MQKQLKSKDIKCLKIIVIKQVDIRKHLGTVITACTEIVSYVIAVFYISQFDTFST